LYPILCDSLVSSQVSCALLGSIRGGFPNQHAAAKHTDAPHELNQARRGTVFSWAGIDSNLVRIDYHHAKVRFLKRRLANIGRHMHASRSDGSSDCVRRRSAHSVQRERPCGVFAVAADAHSFPPFSRLHNDLKSTDERGLCWQSAKKDAVRYCPSALLQRQRTSVRSSARRGAVTVTRTCSAGKERGERMSHAAESVGSERATRAMKRAGMRDAGAGIPIP
jgi:hypothetical protein